MSSSTMWFMFGALLITIIMLMLRIMWHHTSQLNWLKQWLKNEDSVELTGFEAEELQNLIEMVSGYNLQQRLQMLEIIVAGSYKVQLQVRNGQAQIEHISKDSFEESATVNKKALG